MVIIKKLAELTGHSGAVYALEQGEESQYIYSGSGDKITAKWNLNTLHPEKFSAQLPGIIYALSFLPSKNILLAGTSEGKIHVIDLAEKKESKILLNHNQPVFDIKYTDFNKNKVIVLSAGGDGLLSFINTTDFSTIKLLKLCNEKLRAIDVFENTAAVACGDGFIRIISISEQKVIAEFAAHTGSVYSVKFAPDGSYLLSGGKDAHLKKWKLENSEWVLEKSIPAHNYAIYSIEFSPDGKYVATASRDKTFKIWDAENLDVQLRVNKDNQDGHINSVNKLLWNKLTGQLISTGDDRKLMVWEINFNNPS